MNLIKGNGVTTYLTLWDAVKGHEDSVTYALHSCVEKALLSLGDGIYDLEWANMSLKDDKENSLAA